MAKKKENKSEEEKIKANPLDEKQEQVPEEEIQLETPKEGLAAFHLSNFGYFCLSLRPLLLFERELEQEL